MKRIAFIILSYLTLILAKGAEPYCEIALFDEDAGLSQHSVKQIAQDSDGLIWIATWNGLNRFDGYDFDCVRPGIDDETRRYSNRIRDIKPGCDGDLWCRIDDKIVRLDVRTNRFADIHSQLERKLDFKFSVNGMRLSRGLDTVVVECDCGSFITFPVKNPIDGAVRSDKRPAIKFFSSSFRRPVKGYDISKIAFSREAADGGNAAWVVTTDGVVALVDTSTGTRKTVADLEVDDSSMRYCTTDSYGNLWLRCSRGAYRLTLGLLPYTKLKTPHRPSRVLAMTRDVDGRIWVAESGNGSVAVYDSIASSPRYLTPDGRLTDTDARFGHAVYSMYASADGTVWLGSKPDGLYRLTPTAPDGVSFAVERIADGYIYDISSGGNGCLWVATLRRGVMRIENPTGRTPRVTHLADVCPDYPEVAVSCRKLAFENDSTLQVATTSGLLTIALHSDLTTPSAFTLHTSETGNNASLGCVATMDVLPLDGRRLAVATESNGVNLRDADGRFSSRNVTDNYSLDLAQSLSASADGRKVVVVAPRMIYTIDTADGNMRFFGESYWHDKVLFTDCRLLPPVDTAAASSTTSPTSPDARWLAATADGAIAFRFSDVDREVAAPRIMFTKASIQGRADTLLTSATSRVTLGKTERNITLRFAAVNHPYPADIRYAFRVDGGEWTDLGTTRVITLYDLAPQTYDIEVRTSDSGRRSPDSIASLQLDVTPKFYETLFARLIFLLMILALVGGVIRVIVYIRAIKRKQRETLEAYMRLVGATPTPPTTPSETADATSEPTPTPSLPEISEADKEFMNRVMDYVNSHLSDPDSSVDDMAAAIGVSRSGLARKMRSSMGVSAADFLRRTRMSHAAKLLLSTDLPIKEIAYECGFSDLNYFSKSFKAHYSISPTAYRQNHGEKASDTAATASDTAATQLTTPEKEQ